jgi:hypothetical protein
VAAGDAVVAVAAMSSVEDMHQRTQREEDEGKRSHEVSPMLGEKEEAGDCEEAEEDPG